jgi:hypothetical protein
LVEVETRTLATVALDGIAELGAKPPVASVPVPGTGVFAVVVGDVAPRWPSIYPVGRRDKAAFGAILLAPGVVDAPAALGTVARVLGE